MVEKWEQLCMWVGQSGYVEKDGKFEGIWWTDGKWQ